MNNLFLSIANADDSRVSKAFICVCLRVCVPVCPRDRTKAAETTITKVATRIVHHAFNISSKVKSQGHKVQAKHISDDRVDGVSLHSIEYPASASRLQYFDIF